jgi:protein-tyrosine-phosphatase
LSVVFASTEIEVGVEPAARAAAHAALGDERRLAVVDELWLGDRTPGELARRTGLSSNLLAFHLGVLEEAGLVERHGSQGDGRRRYVTLRTAALPRTGAPAVTTGGEVLFVCTHNAARSQLAAAMWRRQGRPASSAGTHPAPRLHPLAVAVAEADGLDLGDQRPRSYDEVDVDPTLVVSVCDRARESVIPFDAPLLHWSLPDPIDGDRRDFERVHRELAARVDRLAGEVAA